jgi:uncharacterized low-complexity protein
MKNFSVKPLSIILGTAFSVSLAGLSSAEASQNPFAFSEVSPERIAAAGQAQCGAKSTKASADAGEAKCGAEGKASKAAAEATCGANGKAAAEASCGADKEKAAAPQVIREASCGEAKCGAAK